MNAPEMQIITIVADPPWKKEAGGGKIKRGADRHYPLMSNYDIHRTMTTHPLWRPNRSRCSLWLWCTARTLPDAMWLLQALGFTYVTCRTWLKVRHNGKRVVGLGQRMRHRAEFLLLGTMGTVPVPEPHNRVDSVLEAERGPHSKKPAQAYDDIIKHDGDGVTVARVEFFAREQRAGWWCTGNEIDDHHVHPQLFTTEKS